MRRLFRYAACLLCLILAAAAVSGCTNNENTVAEDNDLHIYASFYPLYAITEELTRDIPQTYAHCLVQPQDGCLRDYVLSDWDLALLEKSADMVIIGGRGLESFENMLYSLGEDGPAVAAVLYNRELAEGDADETDEESHWQGANPHLYMSTEGAILIAEGIAAQLSTADPANSESYMAKLDEIENRLRSVMAECAAEMQKYSGEKVILMNETAVYTAKAHDLDVEKCILRDSGEAYYDYELEKVTDDLKKCESRVILIEEQAPERFCEALEAAGFRLAKIDTMSAGRAENGFEGYLETLKSNSMAVAAAFEVENEGK